ncbi:hypothetical protein QE152_g30864 [Popillia japonica]|uniref:Uncharacterized protein n=1 Tax=Popillia japonica TaxID=7064 RepID=A0AAW1JD34_POPJA
MIVCVRWNSIGGSKFSKAALHSDSSVLPARGLKHVKPIREVSSGSANSTATTRSLIEPSITALWLCRRERVAFPQARTASSELAVAGRPVRFTSRRL